ncbi:MAG TPA: hypothetical protein VJ802_07690 [Gemmatimonadaceae bacterium]|nr:hypothetical protein [Gemmatimonadaceae bacterium]
MTRPPRSLRDQARLALHEYATAEQPEDITVPEPDAIPADRRGRDLGLPDGLWFTTITLLGIVAGWALALSALPALGEDLAFGLAFGPPVAFGRFAYRRWGPRSYRWRRAIRDGLLTLPIALVAGLLHGVVRLIF